MLRSPLLIRYQEDGGALSEHIIHPRTIRGETVFGRQVRPDIVTAFCEKTRLVQSFRYTAIIWAADAQSGEFIDDLYTYLGSAQPGGAPSRQYSAGPGK